MSRDEVFQNGETFAERGKDRTFDNFTRWFGHQTTSSTKLADLLFVTTSTGIHHQVNRIHGILTTVGLEFVEHCLSDVVGASSPDIDDLVITFTLGDNALLVLTFDFINLLTRSFHDGCLGRWDDHIINTDRNTGSGSHLEACILQPVERDDCLFAAYGVVGLENDIA